MFFSKKKSVAALLLICMILNAAALTPVCASTDENSFKTQDHLQAQEKYINTNRDTKLPEKAIEIAAQNVDEYEQLYETNSAIYYFRDDRDIIAVYDKETGYLWKTGIDSGVGKDLKKLARNAETEEDFTYLERNPIEENLNEVYTDFANSLVSIEYKKGGSVEKTFKASSASKESASVLTRLEKNRYCLAVNFAEAEIALNVYITFDEKGISYDIPFEEIVGAGKKYLCDLYITPFLGSSGGAVTRFNRETGKYDISEKKDAPSGYAFIPDGSGALVRFKDNSVSFKAYTGDVYGADVSQGEYYHRELSDAVALKEPVMPVFGVAYGNNQVAFVAYADQGDEYMSVTFTPEENVTYYNWITPKFSYNTKYHQVYNKAGEGFFTLLEEARNFDVSMTYDFLSGDGSGSTYAANYTGMALAYRDHLIEEGILTVLQDEPGDIPLRLDFIMSDSQSSIVGIENVVVTKAEDVENILRDVMASGIVNINSGLFGWQKKGVTFAKPYTQNFSSAIGTKSQFAELMERFAEQGVDISFGQDYVTINEVMLNYYQTAVRHVSSWYVTENRESLLPDTVPVTSFGYATPQKSAQWLLEQFEATKETVSSMTIQGIGRILSGNYVSRGDIFTVSEAVALYQETLAQMDGEVLINLKAPGKYLWRYTDRYLQSPVGHSQYIFETDAVPFLQMVLHGTMEVYGPYSNFSFYTQSDILKMIDYNLYPSFVLSKEPSYKLADTVSCDLYSTEYALYKELIQEVYTKVNAVLSQVQGYAWVNRTVIADGVIVNTYEKNGQVKDIVINYTSGEIVYKNQTVGALNALAAE